MTSHAIDAMCGPGGLLVAFIPGYACGTSGERVARGSLATLIALVVVSMVAWIMLDDLRVVSGLAGLFVGFIGGWAGGAWGRQTGTPFTVRNALFALLGFVMLLAFFGLIGIFIKD